MIDFCTTFQFHNSIHFAPHFIAIFSIRLKWPIFVYVIWNHRKRANFVFYYLKYKQFTLYLICSGFWSCTREEWADHGNCSGGASVKMDWMKTDTCKTISTVQKVVNWACRFEIFNSTIFFSNRHFACLIFENNPIWLDSKLRSE